MANMMGIQEQVRLKTMEELDFDKATKIMMGLLVKQINQEASRRILGRQGKHLSIQMRGTFVNNGQIEERTKMTMVKLESINSTASQDRSSATTYLDKIRTQVQTKAKTKMNTSKTGLQVKNLTQEYQKLSARTFFPTFSANSKALANPNQETNFQFKTKIQITTSETDQTPKLLQIRIQPIIPTSLTPILLQTQNTMISKKSMN